MQDHRAGRFEEKKTLVQGVSKQVGEYLSSPARSEIWGSLTLHPGELEWQHLCLAFTYLRKAQLVVLVRWASCPLGPHNNCRTDENASSSRPQGDLVKIK